MHRSLVAQWLEHGPYEARVAGSIPVGTIFCFFIIINLFTLTFLINF